MNKLLSIGMPIYNEEKFIEESINSILSQTNKNFELIICDNASTDKTEEICKRLSKKDSRIKYHKNEVNMGSIANFNKSVSLSTGKYFMWAAGHDLWDKKFQEKCLKILEEDEEVSVCHAYTTMLNQDDEVIKVFEEGINVDSKDRYKRVKETIKQLSIVNPNAVYGIIRSDFLKKIRPVQDTYGSDHLNLIELSNLGKIIQIKEPLYFQRKNRENEKTKINDAYNRWSSPKKKKYLKLTYSKMFYSYLKTIKYLKLPFSKRLSLFFYINWIFLTKYWRKILVNDFVRIIIGEKAIYRIRNRNSKGL